MPEVLKQAERADRTRAEIVEAARSLFSTRGYRSVSLREIARQAGISHPALLKHFPTRDLLLARVLEYYSPIDIGSVADTRTGSGEPELPFVRVAAQTETNSDYRAFSATMVGEAAAVTHPGHAAFRERALDFRRKSTAILESAQSEGLVDPGRVCASEALRLAAAWDSLHVIERYLPQRVDVAATLREHQRKLRLPVGYRTGHPRAPFTPSVVRMPLLVEVPEPGSQPAYRSGRERRERIIANAMELFARTGYVDTSVRDIAQSVGLTKSALFNYFPTKDALLAAVLTERDRRIDALTAAEEPWNSANFLRGLAKGAFLNHRDQPGLVELYSVLSGEAVSVDHAAHQYFQHRFRVTLAGFTLLFEEVARSGELSTERDPRHEALWLLALWDGLQYQWLYDRDGVDVASELRAHLLDVLPVSNTEPLDTPVRQGA